MDKYLRAIVPRRQAGYDLGVAQTVSREENEMAKSLTDTVTALYGILEPMAPEDRDRALRAALVLVGDPMPSIAQKLPGADGNRISAASSDFGPTFGPTAQRWLTQNQISRESLDNLFHISNDDAVPIFSSVPGASRREQTVNCYLLTGIRRLLATDEAMADDKEAVDLCQQVGAYDKNNHTSNRKSLGARVTGSRGTGFKLTVPGLREAARLIKMMGSSNTE